MMVNDSSSVNNNVTAQTTRQLRKSIFSLLDLHLVSSLVCAPNSSLFLPNLPLPLRIKFHETPRTHFCLLFNPRKEGSRRWFRDHFRNMASFNPVNDTAKPTKARPISIMPVRDQVAKANPSAVGSAQVEALISFLDSIGNAHEQMELILWKFGTAHGISREEITERLTEFLRFDRSHTGELEENEALQLLEFRGDTRTFRELRTLVAEMDLDNNHKISFVEYACAIYKLDYFSLNDFADEDARQAALKVFHMLLNSLCLSSSRPSSFKLTHHISPLHITFTGS